jgi:hypothetical protein
VIYVTVPPAATPRMLAAEFARFLGLPIIACANITDIIESVCGVAVDTRVGLVCDEIHNLRLTTRTGAEVSDTLKYFSERIPATFVYAGIDVEREGLFAGTRGRQIAGRFCLIETVPFPYGEEWKGLVATFEAALRLHRHAQGALPKLDRYLHQRTGGMIGSLSHLVRGAAIEAILGGSEEVTKSLLDSVELDHAAEASHVRHVPRRGWAGMSNPVGDHPRPLPIRPRPGAGDSVASYIRRLARANHLRPNYLRRHLRRPPGTDKTIDLQRLAAGPAAPYRRSNMSSPTSTAPHHLPHRHQHTKPDTPVHPPQSTSRPVRRHPPRRPRQRTVHPGAGRSTRSAPPHRSSSPGLTST